MKKILVISWFFPPVNSSEGIVTWKLLNASRYNYDVYTQKSNKSWSYGNNESLLVKKNVNRIYSNANNLESWKLEAIEFFKKNQEKYDIVMTRSMPPESHMVGIEIKKIKPTIKLICSFGDPIANNPYSLLSFRKFTPYSLKNRYTVPMSIKYMFSPIRVLKNIYWNYKYLKPNKQIITENIKLQKKIFEYCDYIILNSKEQENYMIQDECIKKKCFIIPHSYDKSMFLHKKKRSIDKISFNYFGQLDEIRTPILLFEALKELYSEHPEIKDKSVFNFYGNMSKNDKLFIIDNNLTDLVKVHKPISYTDSINKMIDSDWLLFFDANLLSLLNENIFFAAKLADYMGSKSNIFAITMIDGASANILRSINALTMTFSKNEIKNYLYLIILKHYQVKQDTKNIENYSSDVIGQSFDKIVSICDRGETK